MKSLHMQAKHLRQMNDLAAEEILFRQHFKKAYEGLMKHRSGGTKEDELELSDGTKEDELELSGGTKEDELELSGGTKEDELELYELLHFMLDFIKYLVRHHQSNANTFRVGGGVSTIQDVANLTFPIDFHSWIHKIASLFAFRHDRDIRRRALEIGFHVLLFFPFLGNEKDIMIDHLEKGFLEYIDLILSLQPDSFEDWWEKRIRFPFSEFMLDHTETRDMICLKFAIKIAIELSCYSCNIWEKVSSLAPNLKKNWEAELIHLFGDHDSDLLKILFRLLSIAEPAVNFRLFLRFLDAINFDHESIMDLIMIDPDLAVDYLSEILLHISSHPFLFKCNCKEIQRTDQVISNPSSFDEADTADNEEEDNENEETDYFESTRATFGDLLALLAASTTSKQQTKKLEISFTKAFTSGLS